MSVPLPTIHLENLGTGPEGITAGELIKQVLSIVVTSTTKEVAGALGKLGEGATEAVKDIGKGTTEGAKKATEGFKGLFKKK